MLFTFKEQMKAIYRNKRSGDIFAIETDEDGKVLSACGPLFGKDFDPAMLDYDQYWNNELDAKLSEFEKLTNSDYCELLRKNGFFPQISQRYLF